MLKNYFKIAFRNLYRNKAYSFINIAGLTMGITCCSLLFMFVISEMSYDSMYSKKDQMFRIVEVDETEEDTRYYGSTAMPVGRTLVADYPEVLSSTQLFKYGGQIVFSQGDVKFDERSYYFADSSFLGLFDVDWIAGDMNTALNKPNSVVIDEDWAQRLYGNEDPIGKEFLLDEENPSYITGVVKNLPENSHLQFKILVSYPAMDDQLLAYMNDWSNYGASTYVLLDEQADVTFLSQKLPDFIAKYFAAEDERNFYLQSLNDIHFGSKDIEYGTDQVKGEITYIYVFISIGIFMLLIACINYMNLATAKSLHRGKEIGMRKVSGATKGQLVTQFLSESTLIALISFAFSIGLVDLLLPFFNQIVDKSFIFNMETFSGVFSLLLIITLAVGLLSGSYPALLMSRLRPAGILKGEMSTGKGSLLLRKILVITQFSLSIVMIIATIVASKQMNFIQNKELGFDKSQLMIVDINNGNVRRRFETMKNEFVKSPYIQKVAVSSRVPGEWKNIREVYARNVDGGQMDSLRVNYIGFDKDMLDVYDIELSLGKNFTGITSNDSLHVMINEAMVEALNLGDPIGRYIEFRGGRYQVSGVLKNFNFQSLHSEIGPLILGYRSNNIQSIDYFSLKFDPKYTQEALAHATQVHNAFDENSPIEHHFLDQQWAEFYKNDQRAGDIFQIGAGITILIACMGLFGLASFIVQKRTKEIGVRKVLGASIPQLFVLLSKTFVVQVGIAFLIAVPLSWYFMNGWLDSFAFKFGLGAGEFLTAGGSALLIALVSVSYRVIKAATLNPASTLKDE
jgi:putative ABC transport system permease protein